MGTLKGSQTPSGPLWKLLPYIQDEWVPICPSFTIEETEAQGFEVMCPRSHRWDSKPGCLQERVVTRKRP